jgi:hypothetical protein
MRLVAKHGMHGHRAVHSLFTAVDPHCGTLRAWRNRQTRRV